jgi:SAM-dependent methyltransferase
MPGTHWSDMTGRWMHVDRPLKPSPDDIAVLERFATIAAQKISQDFVTLLLGVTPEIAGCRWPESTRLTAIDSSPAMIHALWPAPGIPAASRVICADWRNMPLGSGTIDFIAGDGCNAALSFPIDVSAMLSQVARVLRPGGMFVSRVFVRPEPIETVEDIERDLASGRIGSIHVLKWRLFAALCEDPAVGVRLADVWTVWNGMRALAARYGPERGWTPPEISTIEIYRGDVETRFNFPTLAQLRAVISQHFSEQCFIVGGYELADRCPLMVLEGKQMPHQR